MMAQRKTRQKTYLQLPGYEPERLKDDGIDSVRNGMRIHDDGFGNYVASLESNPNVQKEFLKEVVPSTAHSAGNEIALAYWKHDRKDYEATQQHFTKTYSLLYDINDEAVNEAGGGEMFALKSHDTVEDGYDTVNEKDPLLHRLLYDTDLDTSHLSLFNLNDGEKFDMYFIPDHPAWKNVSIGFQLSGVSRGLPEEVTYKGRTVGPFEDESTNFFLAHSMGRESVQKDQERPAKEGAVINWFSTIFEDFPDDVEWGAQGMDGFLEKVTAGELSGYLALHYARSSQAVSIDPLVTHPGVRDHYIKGFETGIRNHDYYSDLGHPYKEVEVNTAVMEDAFTPVVADTVFNRYEDLIAYGTLEAFLKDLGYEEIL